MSSPKELNNETVLSMTFNPYKVKKIVVNY